MEKQYLSVFTMALCLATPASSREIPADQALVWCQKMTDFTFPETRISSAKLVAGEITKEGDALPVHCVVTGHMQERKGSDGKDYSTGFELRLPTTWNERFIFQGGGGTDGSIRPAIGVNTIGKPPLLSEGYAVVSTDAGHTATDGRDASFGMDPKARVDWAFNSLDLVVTIAKSMIQAGYGLHPKYAYLVGSSNGGRQGLMAAQRFPNHFDGVLAGAPILEQSRGHIATAWDLQVVAKIAPKDAQGRPILSKAFSDQDISIMNAAIAAQCDMLDGLKDGLVDSPRNCDFDAQVLACTTEKTKDCLSAGQVDALVKMHRGPVNSAGEALHVSFPWDAGSDFRGWKLGDAEGWPSNARRATNTSIRYVFATPPDPDLDSFAFDFDRDPARLAGSAAHNNATSPDLDAFSQSGGKIIIYHGMGDQGVSALGTVAYYESLQQRYGASKVEDFARLYLMRNIGHSRVGTGPDTFDGFAALRDWVENGNPPMALVATGGQPKRERPLCPYPRAALFDEKLQTFGCDSR